MADLLECLIQIKALAETPSRIEKLISDSNQDAWTIRPNEKQWAGVEIVAHLTDCELLFAVRLRSFLTQDRPILAMFNPEVLAGRALYLNWMLSQTSDRFRRRRSETIELLSSCTAEELAKVGVHPRRGEMTLADMVAVMLAHDTDHIGQIRQRLESVSAR